MVELPAQTYIPGQTPRPAEDAFDHLKGGLPPNSDGETLACSDAWTAGLEFYEAGYFWESHEVLEAVWMAASDGSDEKLFVQAVIQLANARLKVLMNRPNAVLRLIDYVEQLLSDLQAPVDACIWQVDADWVQSELTRLRG